MNVSKQNRRAIEFVIPAVLLIGIIYLITLAKSSVFAFVLSIALAYILNPIINFFEVRGIKRIYTISGLYLTVGIIIFFMSYLFFNFLTMEIATLQISWPDYVKKIHAFINEMESKIVKSYPLVSNLNFLNKFYDYIQEIPQFLIGLFPTLTLFLIVPFITFFVLLGGHNILNYILNHMPSKYVETVLYITTKIDNSLGNYLRGILTEATINFFIAFTSLIIMGLDYAVVIAILVGISTFVPYLGPILGVIIASIIIYFQYYSIGPVFKVLVLFAGIRFMDDWFLQPYIMKKAVKLNPAIVVFALLAGLEIGGFWGVIFCIPVTCIIKELIQVLVELQETEFRWKPGPEPTRISIPYT